MKSAAARFCKLPMRWWVTMTEINLAFDEPVCPELERKRELRPLLESVRGALRAELAKHGMQPVFGAVPIDVQYCELRNDSLSDSTSFYGEWHDATGKLLGNLIAHAGGEFFAEYDVLCAHPNDRRWFVEAVTAWGRPGVIKTELRLLPALPA